MDAQRGNESSKSRWLPGWKSAVARWPWGWISAVAGIILGIAAAVITGWRLLDPTKLEDERAKISAIQVIAALGFGVGGIGTLMLFVRRQWLQEQAHKLDQQKAELDRRVAADNRHDAEERRITDLYMKAADQLGHDKASVRLAALYALDRLGQNHEGHRQVIVDIWCAYLRQPFTPPARFTAEDATETPEPSLAPVDSTVYSDHYLTPSAKKIGPESERELRKEEMGWEQEYEVRATAQRLLARHLYAPRPPKECRDDNPPPAVAADGYWGVDRIELTGAILIDMDFRGCWFPQARFSRAQFRGYANFEGTQFRGYTRFEGAQFHGYSGFADAQFHGPTGFAGTEFHRNTGFADAQFHGPTGFRNTKFQGFARFEDAQVHQYASFEGAQFHGYAWFEDIRVSKRASLSFNHASAVLVSPDMDDMHVWPPGYQLAPFPAGEGQTGWGKLVKVDDGLSTEASAAGS